MEIKEAIDTLKNKICDYVIPNYCKDCENKSECLDDCNFILSIYTVLQEIEHLQKENEELKAKQVMQEFKIDWCEKNTIGRGKIREKIEEINKLLPDIDYRDIEDKKEREYYKKEYYKAVAERNILQNLLKEE